MKRFYAFCGLALAICACADAFAATVLKPKKAAPVATQDLTTTSTTNVGASMLPNALNLVQGVMALNQQQKALKAECYPTTSEINFVNNMVKEWANAGVKDPFVGTNKNLKCDNGDSYKASVLNKVDDPNNTTLNICWDVFKGEEARGAVWSGFPKATVVDYYPKGDKSSKTTEKSSNMWDIFAMIDFGDADYTKSEASQAAALRQKLDRCSDAKLAAQQKAAVGNFITGTIGNLGQSTNTGSVMEAVTGIMGQSGMNGVGNLANIAVQFIDK